MSTAGELPSARCSTAESCLDFSEDWIGVSISQRFDQVAARYEDKIAVDDGDVRLSYGKLREMALALAGRIEALLPPGRPVGVLLPSCALSPVAALACLLSNRPYVPIDCNHPTARNEQLMRETGLQAVITLQTRPSAGPSALSLQVLDVTSSPDATVGPRCAMTQDGRLAVILFTSGSTGAPKGVCHDENGILYRVAHATRSYRLGVDDHVMLLSSPSTIVGVRETLASLLNGATLHLFDVQKLGLRGTLEALKLARPTVGYIAPVLLRSVLALPEAGTAFSAARMVRLGGDVIFDSDVLRCRTVLPRSCDIFITLTSTESPAVFQWIVPRDCTAAEGARLPVGYPRPGVQFMISDETGAPVADGETGELVVRSRYLALGYWSAGELLPGPFVTDAGDPAWRTFRTGDLVRMRDDGLVEMIGRRDRQLKIRGFRADPREAEAVLRQCANVADAAVIARVQDETVSTLIGFVVGRNRADDSLLDAVRNEVCARLPPHMRPTQIRLVDSIPYLPNFKADVQALERLDREECAKERLTVQRETLDLVTAVPKAPIDASDIRAAVERTWVALLDRRSFKADLRWDEAGGDSLGALHLWVQMENELGRRLPLEALGPHLRPSEVIAILEKGLSFPSDQPAHGQIPGQRPTVFFMPPAEGDAPTLARFRAAFDDNVRFVVIAYPSLNEMLREDRSRFDAIVNAAVMQVLAAVNPNEQCYFTGYSFGGVVAWETARRMLALNYRVAFVGLLDSRLTPPHGIILRAGRLDGHNRLTPYRILRRAYDRAFSHTVRVAPAILARLARLLPVGASLRLQFQLLVELRLQARRKWQPSPLPIPTWLFRSDQFSPSAPDHNWGAVAARLKVVPIGGSHLSILEPPFHKILCPEFLEALRIAASA